MKWRDPRVLIARREEHCRILFCGLHFLIRRIGVKIFELRGIGSIPVLEQGWWIVILEPLEADHVEVRELTEYGLKYFRTLRESCSDKQTTIAAVLDSQPRWIGIFVFNSRGVIGAEGVLVDEDFVLAVQASPNIQDREVILRGFFIKK